MAQTTPMQTTKSLLSIGAVANLFFALLTFTTSAAPGDENWDTRFSSENAGGEIRSMVVKNGELYVAGKFMSVDGTNTSNLAKWNGTTWIPFHSFGYGEHLFINAIASNDDGIFTGGTLEFIEKWDGSEWSMLPNFPTVIRSVSAMHGSGTNLYVSGEMWVNNVPAGIVQWDGAYWRSLSTSNLVGSLITKGADLYAGGLFNRIGNGGVYSITNLARWNGTVWSGVGGGVNGRVRCMAVLGNDLYVGGDFTIAGTVSVSRIAKWNGTAWSGLGTGLNGSARALTVNGSNLYVAGEFSTAGGISASRLAKWNGSAWSAVNIPLQNGSVKTLASLGTNIYAGGKIDAISGQKVGNIVSYNGTNWQKLKSGVSFGKVNAIRVIGNDIYVGGDWRSIAGTNIAALARYDGTNWSSVGTGISNSIGDVIVADIHSNTNGLFIGGSFNRAGGVNATNIAKWNGTNWQAVGTGLGTVEEGIFGTASRDRVFCLATRGNELFAGGAFESSSFSELARWNGSTWSRPGSTSPDNWVYSLCNFGSDLYVGGYFYNQPVSSFRSLVKWNGSSWTAVGSGTLDGPVYAMTASGTNLYIGGGFTKIGTLVYNNIAKWNGSSWQRLTTSIQVSDIGVNREVTTMLAVGNDLYVGGEFTSAGGKPANHIAKWDGTNWWSLGSGVGDSGSIVSALALKGDDLLVGGSFLTAGDKRCHHLAVWQTKPRTLLMQPSGNSMSLSWPAGITPFALQSASDLSSTNWSDVESAASLSNGNYVLVTNSSAEAQFFRLRQK
jgi:trimeric autotransporter adhesin